MEKANVEWIKNGSSRPVPPEYYSGAHFYAFSPVISLSKYGKAMATITLPTDSDMNYGPSNMKRHAFISLGMLSSDAGTSFDMGLCNFNGDLDDKKMGWQICFGGLILRTTVRKASLPSYVRTVTILVEDVGTTKSKMRISVGYVDQQGKPINNEYDYDLSQKYKWNYFYRFASLMHDEENNPLNDGSKMMNVQFSDLGLYNIGTGRYEPWGLYTDLIDSAWMVGYPQAQFVDYSVTGTSERFNINNNRK